ncbi:MAG: RluA family pseudouridine synthase [Termitinemataceae bacterium]|nr:MAG: RluA family pseudouridine synthase [Termitinemataceae bacterium]
MPSYTGLVTGQSMRLDVYIAQNLSLMRRSQIKRRNLQAIVNGKKVKVSCMVKNNDFLNLTWQDDHPLNLSAEHIPLKIIYEDKNLIVINKQQGLVVHPGAGNFSGTLIHGLLWHFSQGSKVDVETFGNTERPFIVHRLDKDTSGVIICAKNMQTLSFLSDQFRDRKTRKTYVAIVKGIPQKTHGKISQNIVRDPKNRKRFIVCENGKGKTAITYYRVVRSFGTYAMLMLRPKTGRTHQLRVHLKALGTPILGDIIYNKSDKYFKNASLMLHAKSLAIELPGESGRHLFKSRLPLRFKRILEKLVQFC